MDPHFVCMLWVPRLPNHHSPGPRMADRLASWSRCLVAAFVLVAPVAVAQEQGSGFVSGFVAGAVCDGLPDINAANASWMLRGRHLKVYEAVWDPFAVKDADAPHGWSGYDIDLITLVADELQFTFDIHEMTTRPGELTWTPMLFRSVPDSDLVLSYWARTTDRLDRVRPCPSPPTLANSAPTKAVTSTEH